MRLIRAVVLMLASLVVSGTERVLLMLGWERETDSRSRKGEAAYTAQQKESYKQLKSDLRARRAQSPPAKSSSMFAETQLRPVGVGAAPTQRPRPHSQMESWTSASAFDVAPTGTV